MSGLVLDIGIFSIAGQHLFGHGSGLFSSGPVLDVGIGSLDVGIGFGSGHFSGCGPAIVPGMGLVFVRLWASCGHRDSFSGHFFVGLRTCAARDVLALDTALCEVHAICDCMW